MKSSSFPLFEIGNAKTKTHEAENSLLSLEWEIQMGNQTMVVLSKKVGMEVKELI